jgi:heme A synthase
LKDVTSTSFGYIVAFLLPGLAALYALSLWSAKTAEILRTFLTSNSNIGLFLLVTATALGFGLLVSVFRAFLFQNWLYRGYRLQPSDFAQLSTEAKLTAYRAAIDETYRYHQFFGGITVVLPFLYLGWLLRWNETNVWLKLLSVVLFIMIEYGIGKGAMVEYSTYVKRAKYILQKDTPAGEGGS